MNRKILFRGFNEDPDGNEEIELDGKIIKGKWVEGYLVEYIHRDTVYIDGTSPKESYIFPMAERSQLKCLVTKIEVIPKTVSQYTGFLDIYENDIVCISTYSFEEPEFDGDFRVEYNLEVGCWFFVDIDNKEKFYTIEELRNFYKIDTKIIGTIFDKKEV